MSKEAIFEIYSVLLFSEYVNLRVHVCILLRVARINNEKKYLYLRPHAFHGRVSFYKNSWL